jgi:hypothetical protein
MINLEDFFQHILRSSPSLPPYSAEQQLTRALLILPNPANNDQILRACRIHPPASPAQTFFFFFFNGLNQNRASRTWHNSDCLLAYLLT